MAIVCQGNVYIKTLPEFPTECFAESITSEAAFPRPKKRGYRCHVLECESSELPLEGMYQPEIIDENFAGTLREISVDQRGGTSHVISFVICSH
jgi:hypothetical protein